VSSGSGFSGVYMSNDNDVNMNLLLAHDGLVSSLLSLWLEHTQAPLQPRSRIYENETRSTHIGILTTRRTRMHITLYRNFISRHVGLLFPVNRTPFFFAMRLNCTCSHLPTLKLQKCSGLFKRALQKEHQRDRQHRSGCKPMTLLTEPIHSQSERQISGCN
jgi:hypothetical protein